MSVERSPKLIAPYLAVYLFVISLTFYLTVNYWPQTNIDSMKKVRIDGRTVETTSGQVNVKGSTAVILDDIISTGGTIATAVNILRDGGAERVFAACTHGLFIEDAANRLRVCDDILSSDTLEGVYTRFSVAPAIADAL